MLSDLDIHSLIIRPNKNKLIKKNMSNARDNRFEGLTKLCIKNNILHLVSSINSQMWLGHFDIWIDEGVVLYRNTSLFNRNKISQNQFDEVMMQAVASCDQFFPAFQYVLWANKSSTEALEAVLFSTQGEA